MQVIQLKAGQSKNFSVGRSQISRAPGRQVSIELSGPIEAKVTGSQVVPGSQVDLVGDVQEVNSTSVLVSATVTARWIGECTRCLEPAQGVMNVELRELFSENRVSDDELTYRLDPEVVDMSDMVRDACILELPQVPLCSTTCKGLCSECGENLNFGRCGCS